jgi:hypothetical protein
MAKRLTREEKRELIGKEIINEMFKIAGHNVVFEDIKDRQDAWYTQWTMTDEQNAQWKKWGEEKIKSDLKLNKELAKKEMAWFDLMYGLKIDNQINY